MVSFCARSFAVATVFVSLVGCVALTGCGVAGTGDAPSAGTLSLSGRVHGGQQPVSGSTIQLWAAGSSGYGSAATPKLTSVVTTDAGGNFNFSTLYTCPSSTTQMYVTATQGNPGMSSGTNNAGIAMMAALGPCGNLSPSTEILINEETTVAAVWALAPFMTAYDHVGTSATNAVGLANAFSTAAVLANVASGTVPGYAAPAGSVVPTAEINTLANIMASCINTAGGVAGDGSACGKLYGYTTVGSSVPANTVGAMLNEAKNPALNGLPYALVQNPTSPFYLLVSGTGPYQPALSAAPTDWTIAVSYPTGGSGVPFNDLFTQTIAIDSNGDAFIVDTKALHELSPAGLNIGNNLTMGGSSVGLDATGDIWVGGYTGTPSPGYFLEAASIVSEPTRSSIGSPGVGANDVTSFSFDPNGSMWYACDYCSAMYGPKGAVGAASDFHGTFAVVDQSGNAWHGDSAGILSVVNSNGVPIGGSPYKNLSSGGVGLTSSSLAIAAAIDSNGFAWISGGNCLLKATTTGSFTFVGGPTGSLLSGIYAPFGIAVDGANNVWAANPQNAFYSSIPYGGITEVANNGTAIAPRLGFVSSTMSAPSSLAIDGSGNVWIANSGAGTVTVFVGAASPVVTPLAVGVKNGMLGTMP